MIEIRNLSKSYNKGQVKAVDGLDLKVNRGEIFGSQAQRRREDHDDQNDSQPFEP